MRMLMNNLDEEVAEDPRRLIVYGGSGRAARSWDAFHAIIRSLNDALRPDVDPASRSHLSVHRQVEAFEAIELVACGPFRDEVGIGNQDSG